MKLLLRDWQRIAIEAGLTLTVIVLFALLMHSMLKAEVLGKKCSDFRYQQDAQQAYEMGNTRLDGNDKDGLACENLDNRP